ncbi:cysteine and histidine-rich domain-containing protein 1-like [Littorina saxatilis]|uniref:Cysteine and histidine-rich domain-containing protein 1 n=1 Tax=Littorina saxatilis TaxID=31220 RepID=A0AAN9BKM8_9CAEN
MATLQCYNKGCGIKFDPEQNTDTSCQYHPGQPVFHDALKGWSCCKKRSTDFTEFLNFKGCTTGSHSNVKPPEPEKPAKDENVGEEDIVVEPPRQKLPKPVAPSERPSSAEPMQRLKATVATSLRTQLEKLKLEGQADAGSNETEGKDVAIGTQCKNSACKCVYEGPETNDKTCLHHPGVPIFHEGMKYWTCCNRKTSDFDNFLNQEGCAEGKHVWVKSKEQQAAEAKCRVDWHQTGPNVCVSIFAKMADPEKSYFEANRVALNVYIVFGKGSSVFQHTYNLKDVIRPEESEVKLLGTKVEINMKKAEPFHWPSLEIPPESPVVSNATEHN